MTAGEDRLEQGDLPRHGGNAVDGGTLIGHGQLMRGVQTDEGLLAEFTHDMNLNKVAGRSQDVCCRLQLLAENPRGGSLPDPVGAARALVQVFSPKAKLRGWIAAVLTLQPAKRIPAGWPAPDPQKPALPLLGPRRRPRSSAVGLLSDAAAAAGRDQQSSTS